MNTVTVQPLVDGGVADAAGEIPLVIAIRPADLVHRAQVTPARLQAVEVAERRAIDALAPATGTDRSPHSKANPMG